MSVEAWFGPDTRLLLEGPLAAAGGLGWAYVLALLVPLAWILYLARGSGRASIGARLALGLRLFVLALAWAMLALEPTLVQTREQIVPSRVMVAVDLSSSMEAVDPQRSADEREALARALEWTDGPDDRIDRTSRREIARQLLTSSPVRLLERLAASHDVELVGFHQDLVDGLRSDALAEGPPAGEVRETDLRLPVHHLARKGAGGPGKHLGLILLSDGRHQRAGSPLDLARDLGARRLAVYAVPIGARQAPSGVAVVEVNAPAQVFKDADTTVEARIRVRNLPAQDLTVELHDASRAGKSLGERVVAHAGGDGVHKVRFDVKLAELGLRRLEVRVRGRSKDPQAPAAEHRLASLVRVGEEKLRVLLVDGEARWEHQYLAGVLSRDPDLLVDRILFEPPSLDSLKEDQRAAARLPARRWPEPVADAEDPLWAYDCIVLGDIASRHLRPAVQDRLEKYVAEREGTLVLSAGRRHLPLDYLRAPSENPLAKLVPIEAPRALVAKEGFTLQLSDAGAALPFTQPPRKDESARPWEELPALYWGLVGKPRPGAIAVASARTPDTVEPKGPADAALMAMQHVGLGKVVWVGTDSTWRWRYRVGDQDHHRFWGQLVRWAASEGGTPAGDRIALPGTRKPAYAFGQAVDVFLQPGAAVALEPASARVAVVRIGPDGKENDVTSLLLRRNEKRPGLWEGRIPRLEAGDYRLRSEIPELAGKAPAGKAPADGAGRRDRFTVLPPESGELADLATDFDLLKALAEQTGGRVVAVDELATLPDLLARQITSREERSEWRPWRDPPYVWWVLGLLLALLTAEWIVRKWVGLP